MGQGRQSLDDLAGKAEAHPHGTGGLQGKKPVVKAATVAEPLAAAVKERTGQDDQVDACGCQFGLLDEFPPRLGNTQIPRLQIAFRVGDADHAQAGDCR